MVKSERGVTLVELIIALAIAGLLAVSVLFSRDQFRTSQQFTQGVDLWVQTLEQARGEASSTVGKLASGGNTVSPSDEYVLGSTVGITIGATTGATMNVNTVVVDKNNVLVSKNAVNTYNVEAPLAYLVANPTPGSYGAGPLVVFFALQPGGGINVYWGPGLGTNGVDDAYHGLTQVTTTPLDIKIQNPANPVHFNADVYVDRFGNVTRTITL